MKKKRVDYNGFSLKRLNEPRFGPMPSCSPVGLCTLRCIF